MGIDETRRPLQPLDLVLLEQELDAAGQFLDRGSLFALQRGEIELDLTGLDPELCQRAMRGLVEQLRAMQQRLGGNAAQIEASPAQRLARLGAGDLEAQLRGADGGDIAAGSGADDEEVVVRFSQVGLRFAWASTSSAGAGLGIGFYATSAHPEPVEG